MKVKRAIGYTVIGFALTLSVILIFRSIGIVKEREYAALNQKKLTQIVGNFTLISHGKREINYQAKTILIYFNSECEYCQEEFQDIKNNPEALSDVQCFLVSHEPTNDINTFVDGIGLHNSISIFVFRIEFDKIPTTFGKPTVPQIYTYQNNSLIQSFKGKTTLRVLLNSFSE